MNLLNRHVVTPLAGMCSTINSAENQVFTSLAIYIVASDAGLTVIDAACRLLVPSLGYIATFCLRDPPFHDYIIVPLLLIKTETHVIAADFIQLRQSGRLFCLSFATVVALRCYFSSKRDLEECTCVIKLLGTNNSVGFLVTL